MQWRDQVAIVTGGGRGIGRATARLLAARGAAVAVNYAADAASAKTAAAEIGAAGGRAVAVAADVSDPAAVKAMVDQVQSQFGPATILVNNAGIAAQATLETYDPAEFSRMRAVNVDGVINMTRAVMGGMRAANFGRIINIASIAGIGTTAPGNAFYAATKAAVIILTRRFAMELGPHGITVNAVAPGFVRTDMTQRGRGASNWQAIAQDFASRAMMGRIGDPEDIAYAVGFFAAPEASWITAQTLTVDGGRMDFTGHS